MRGDAHAVVLVHATSHAVRIERLLARRGIECKMIPVPRRLSSDCGVCIRIRHLEIEAVRRVIEDASMEIQGIVEVQIPEQPMRKGG